ncbi:TonB-dependent receptor [Pedobacter metabolipauper]|uniref:Carboxypeptidase family protein n=1 Tax=Pedobacter metabolipauper TaxID=425513 RepID=A0A4V3D1G6_9SPHI|nr:TonB-dependent receptor [Pedobacter metabolipauper]TDQ11113.1 carboxypeptidase family protein [Pedobacter metabolipauper]
MFLRVPFLFLLLFASTLASAQKASIKGIVTDTLLQRKLANSSILLIRSADSVLVRTARTNTEGRFELNNLTKGDYKVLVTYPKMADYIRNVSLSDSTAIHLGKIIMELKAKLLKEVIIKAKKPVQLKGDTLVFQADSFAVRPNANLQELLKRLPGFIIDKNGRIKSQGKEIRTVLVDGDEFFGDDPLLATKYLKANAVEEVQVYDRKSKYADLSGIDDGVRNKTINIKLKEDAKNGYLSALDANAGSPDFKDYGGMLGVFKNKLKAALFGSFSNLNNESRINNSVRKLKGEEYDAIEVGDDGSSILYAYGVEDDDDDNAPTGGLPENLNLGAHLSNRFNNNKMAIKSNFKSFDYNNINTSTTNTKELLPNGAIFFSSGRNQAHSHSTGESLRGSYSYALDSLSALKISFGLKQTRVNTDAFTLDDTKNGAGLFISQNNQSTIGSGKGETYNGNINWSRRFNKKGRTLSIDIQPERQLADNTEQNINRTKYFDDNGDLKNAEYINLQKENFSGQNSIAARISYTEPLAKNWTMEAGYSFKTMATTSYRFVSDNGIRKIDSLSNNFKFINFSNVGKMVFQYKVRDFSISTGMEATQTNFELRDLDSQIDFERNYLNLAPNANLFYKLNANSSISVNYNGFMMQPGITQLQPVRQLNNPLYQIIGNSSLRPSFSNNFGLSYNSYQFKSDEYISGYFNYGFTNNAIVNTEIVDDFNKRIFSFTNLDGNNTTSGSIYYSKGFAKLNLRMGFDLGFNNSNNIAIINFTKNKIRNTQYNLRTTFNYYTAYIDLSYSPSATFLNGRSSIGDINDGNSLMHDHEFSGTIQLPYRLEFNTTVSLSFRPANASFDRDLNIAIWNSYLSTKLLKSESLEIKVSVTDILNQKIGYSRFVGGNIITENTFSYIPRYILIGVNWNLSGNFMRKSGKNGK